jgi:hypothetical protein
MKPKDERTIQEALNNLYDCFMRVYEGRASVLDLLKKSNQIEEIVACVDGFYDSPDFGRLEEVFGFTGQLHDPETQIYIETHRQELLHYLRVLLE